MQQQEPQQEQQQQVQQQSQPKKISALPKRPKRTDQVNKIASRIDLVSNHFRVSFTNSKEKINVYSIDIAPEIPRDARELRSKILESMDRLIKEAGLKVYQIKGMNLWSSIRIDETLNLQSPTEQYAVRIKLVKNFSYEDFSSDTSDARIRNPVVQTVNVAIKDALRKLGLKEIGRNAKYYDPREFNQNKVQGGLKVWRGFKTTLCLFDSIPYCLIDFSSRVLRQFWSFQIEKREETALQYLLSLRGNNRDIQQQMVGLSVISPYGNYRIYRIDDIDFQTNPTNTFTLNDNTKISFIDYYQTRYKITIKDKKQPLIISLDKRNPDKLFYLIPELVMLMTGMTDFQRKDFRLMQEVSQFTKLTPEQRNQEVMYLQGKLQQQLAAQNIQLSNDQKVSGFQLNAPSIKLGNKELKNDTGFFILKDHVLKSGYLKDWFFIYVSHGKNDDQDADFLAQKLQQNGAKIGIKIDEPYFIAMNTFDVNVWIRNIEKEIQQGGKPQMIVSLVADNKKEQIYTALKDFCLNSIEIGISHQNILTKFFRNKNQDAVASKIVQQINVKIGMPIWSIPRPPQVSGKTINNCKKGIDIYHKLVSGNRSCMGIVASLDDEFSQYYSRVLLMKKGTEMATQIAGIIEQAIKTWYEFNGKKFLPETIIVYRDGVGEGQVQTLIDTEVSQVKAAFSRIDPNFKPQFAEIMINKKINHRFFALEGGRGDSRPQSSRGAKGGQRNQLINPPSGTVVADKVVTGDFDFFLCAQYVTQGTCTPTHFIVLENTTNWSEETFWMLTYYQCFNYMNWSGAVRVPACVQYAHKLSYLVGDTFQKDLNPLMERRLCFL